MALTDRQVLKLIYQQIIHTEQSCRNADAYVVGPELKSGFRIALLEGIKQELEEALATDPE